VTPQEITNEMRRLERLINKARLAQIKARATGDPDVIACCDKSLDALLGQWAKIKAHAAFAGVT
jgi:hypothetical protein